MRVQGVSLMADMKVYQLNKIKMELKEEQVMRSRVRDEVERELEDLRHQHIAVVSHKVTKKLKKLMTSPPSEN